jgi:hypothetical protein
VLTTPKALHDLIVDRAPQRVVIEIYSIAGWVGDRVRSLGVELQVDTLKRLLGQKTNFCGQHGLLRQSRGWCWG